MHLLTGTHSPDITQCMVNRLQGDWILFGLGSMELSYLGEVGLEGYVSIRVL